MSASTTEPDVKPDETADPPPTEAPSPEPDETQTPPEPVQPAEVDPDAEKAVVAFQTPAGSLTLRPNQKTLDKEQRAALVAIGIDVQNDPGVADHVRPFMHMCQVRGLDPYLREAYLIGRGKGSNRKWTMQTGIDGYRKMGNMTNRFIRVRDRLWTGADDDDRSYFRDEHGVMRRVWYDQWPASRGYPGAAKVVIEHYDVAGNVVTTEAVADWAMYAPFTDVWEDKPGGGRRPKTNPDGSKVQELSEMWRKGYAHMLAKCAEALAYRIAFPAQLSGVYTHEEMHRADQQERDRVEAEVRAARQRAYAEAQHGTPTVAPVEAPDDAEAPAGPMPLTADVADLMAQSPQSTAPSDTPEAPAAPEASMEQRTAWLHEELTFQSDVLGHTPARLANRAVKALRKNVEDFGPGELLSVVAPIRPAVVARLAESGNTEDSEKYATLGPADVVDVHALLVVDGEVVEDHEGVDPEAEHAYVDEGGACDVCGLPENVGPHPE